jgi:hypothetical protein
MHLLRRIECYLRRSGTTPTRFGRNAVRDPSFVFDLRLGRQPRPPVERRVQAYLDELEMQQERSR